MHRPIPDKIEGEQMDKDQIKEQAEKRTEKPKQTETPIIDKVMIIIQLLSLPYLYYILTTTSPSGLVLESAKDLPKMFLTLIISKLIIYLPLTVIFSMIVKIVDRKTHKLQRISRILEALNIVMIILLTIYKI